jgi:hypothetical protein
MHKAKSNATELTRINAKKEKACAADAASRAICRCRACLFGTLPSMEGGYSPSSTIACMWRP